MCPSARLYRQSVVQAMRKRSCFAQVAIVARIWLEAP
jgi:hypothetical protein